MGARCPCGVSSRDGCISSTMLRIPCGSTSVKARSTRSQRRHWKFPRGAMPCAIFCCARTRRLICAGSKKLFFGACCKLQLHFETLGTLCWTLGTLEDVTKCQRQLTGPVKSEGGYRAAALRIAWSISGGRAETHAAWPISSHCDTFAAG